MRAWLPRVLGVLAVLALGWSAAIWLTGGFTFRLAGARISSNNAWRPLLAGVIAAVLFVRLLGWRRVVLAAKRAIARVTPARAAVGLAVATTAIGLYANTWTASGADGFAYVSQAALWRSGRLDVPVPLAANAPWPRALETFVPFGYCPAPHGAAAIVPITAPAVPLLMALLQTIAGHWAAFVVAPAAGGALVLLTFAIGRRVRSPATGLIAAWLVATSPAVLFMLMWPMTDVPAAACTAWLIWLLLGESTGSAFRAGLVASLGVMTRLNFIVIAAGAGLWLLCERAFWRNDRVRPARIAVFAIGLVPGLLVMAGLNTRWYGSPLSSGYGAAGDLLSSSPILLNAFSFVKWLGETAPLALLGLAVIAVPARRVWKDAGGRRTAVLFAIVIATACSVYLAYEPHVEWWYLRYLLPAFPALWVATAVVLDRVRARGRLAAASVAVIAIAAGIAGVIFARTHGVFALDERRYATIARLVESATEPTAVIITAMHSGTIRYYAGRETVRAEFLDAAWLDRAVAWLAAQGRHPYILLEDWEQPDFEARFRPSNTLGALAFPPALAWRSAKTPGWIWLYDPLRRDATTMRPGPEIELTRPWCAPPAAEPRVR